MSSSISATRGHNHNQSSHDQGTRSSGSDARISNSQWETITTAEQPQQQRNGQEEEETPERGTYKPLQLLIYWFKLPYSLAGHIFSVDQTRQYREHFVWACEDGDKLIRTVTARFQSTSVFLSLLMSTTLMVLFNSSAPVESVREALKGEEFNLEFFTGLAMCFSTICSLGALLANFTAWAIFTVISKENASVIMRSSLGLYAEQLPNRLVILAIYMFLMWLILFYFVLMPSRGASVLMAFGIIVVGHIASTYSAIGQIIMATAAMSSERILPVEEAEKMSPQQLYHVLLHETLLARKANVKVSKQYRMDYHHYLREYESSEMSS